MSTIINQIDWPQAISVLWTVILLPMITYFGAQIERFIKAKRLSHDTALLYQAVLDAVKDVYETMVKDIKGTPDWTEQRQYEIKRIAKAKAVHALATPVYQFLRSTNENFDEYLESLIGTALFDLKNSS